MKGRIVFALLLGSALLLACGPSLLFAQGCKDEEGMVADYKKTVADLVEDVKKESLPDFERTFRQKTIANKLMFFGSMVDGLIDCLQKSAADPATPKEAAEAAKAELDAYGKLKDKIKQDHDAIKAAQPGKKAKTLIEKISYST